MVIALVSVVLVWWYLQQSIVSTGESVTSGTTTTPVVGADGEDTTPVGSESDSSTVPSDPGVTGEDQPIPVADLPLTTEQRQLAESLGLDVNQMTLSPELISCAREKLGESRYQAILTGDTPGVLETARLLPCLGR